MSDWTKGFFAALGLGIMGAFSLLFFTTGTSETVAKHNTVMELHERDKAENMAEWHKRSGSDQATIEKYKQRADMHDANVQADLAYAKQKALEAQGARDVGANYAADQLAKNTNGAVTVELSPEEQKAALMEQFKR